MRSLVLAGLFWSGTITKYVGPYSLFRPSIILLVLALAHNKIHPD